MHTVYAAWRESLRKIPLPGAGCFVVSYPSMTWSRTACSTRGNAAPKDAPRIEPAGDYLADVYPYKIHRVTGSFPAVSGVTGVTSTKTASGDGSYSLQLGSNFFQPPVCGGCPAAWVQFYYGNPPKNQSGTLQIWDWLIQVQKCPAHKGWHTLKLAHPIDGVDCYQTFRSLAVPNQPITNLADMQLTGSASASAGDGIELTVGNTVYAVQNAQHDDILDLSGYWSFAEFNVFGYGAGSTSNIPSSALFNKGSAVTVRVEVEDGHAKAPTCRTGSGTVQINNLSFGPAPKNPPELLNPSILFTESNPPSSGASTCDQLAGT